MSDSTQNNLLARAQELRQRGEAARRRDPATARKSYEEAVALFREVGQPLVLAHTIRHLGDVYQEQGDSTQSEPCYIEALKLYRTHGDASSLDAANAIRSLAVLRWEQAKTLWQEAGDLYTKLNIEAGIKESSSRVSALSTR
jgi:tetratricopeptide (TPR) repeat protein